MSTYTKQFLTSSDNGEPILVAATSGGGSGTAVSVAHSTLIDEHWIYAQNTHSSALELVIEFGGTTSPDNLIIQTIQPKSGLILVVPGLPLSNSKPVTAYCAGGANKITLSGFKNQITN